MEANETVNLPAKPEPFSIADVKKHIAPNATEKELFVFLGICRSYGLNPLKREIHFVKYGQNPGTTIVGYEVYIKRAERTGKLDGWRVWIDKDTFGEKAIIEIRRKDFAEPFRWEVYRKEFDRGQANWKTMPSFMLKKVAIAQGFRLAFPDDLGGMPYIPEELPEARTGHATSEALPAARVEDVPEPEPSVVDTPAAEERPTATTAQTAAILDLAKRRKQTPVEMITAALGYDKGISEITKAEASIVLTFHNKKKE